MSTPLLSTSSVSNKHHRVEPHDREKGNLNTDLSAHVFEKWTFNYISLQLLLIIAEFLAGVRQRFADCRRAQKDVLSDIEFIYVYIYFIFFNLLHRSVLRDEHDEVRSRFIILQAVASMHPWKNIGPEKNKTLQVIMIFLKVHIYLTLAY